jgi:hypothetical protein
MTLHQVSLFDPSPTTALVRLPSRAVVNADDAFDRFWNAYPRKVGKKDARRAFERALRDGADVCHMLATIEAWRGEWQARPQFCPHPSTWLNKGRWDDDPPAPRTTVELATPRLSQGMTALAMYRERRR